MEDLVFSSQEFTDWAALGQAIKESDETMACESYPDTMFPENGPLEAEHKLAMEICGNCPVRVQCFQFALKYNHGGIWGGTTEGERRSIRRSARWRA